MPTGIVFWKASTVRRVPDDVYPDFETYRSRKRDFTGWSYGPMTPVTCGLEARVLGGHALPMNVFYNLRSNLWHTKKNKP
jgi:hypothetical protein